MNSDLFTQIRQFYDQSTPVWEAVWGEHLHHGFYGRAGTEKSGDRKQAQIRLIEEFLDWGQVKQIQTFLDAGCGVGGSTCYLAQKYGAQGWGVTLSPVQQERAARRAEALGLAEQTHFQVADAQAVPVADNTFDLVWSLESGEHMPDKRQFLAECWRVLRPGGKLLLATWCHRPTNSWAGLLTPAENELLAQIYEVYCLPYVISLPEYAEIATDVGFKQLHTADWSTAVAPFWDVVMQSALGGAAFGQLLQAGWGTIRGALAIGLMSRGYDQGLIRFGLLQGIKPT
ncbi:MAG: methyltransferase domain-containing protein [Cyanobacteria bacterium P01_H01_bin.15]